MGEIIHIYCQSCGFHDLDEFDGGRCRNCGSTDLKFENDVDGKGRYSVSCDVNGRPVDREYDPDDRSWD